MSLPEYLLTIRLLREDWGFSFGDIAGYLNEKGVPTPRDGKKWSRTNVFSQYKYWWLDYDSRRYHSQEAMQHAHGKVFSWAMYPV